jgi:hypothetical protein
MLVAVILLYIVGYFLLAGIEFAFYQRAFPMLAEEQYRTDLIHAYLFATLSVLGLIIILSADYRRKAFYEHGLKFK